MLEHRSAERCSACMSQLMKFLLFNGLTGFTLGLVTGVAYLLLQAEGAMFLGDPLALCMILWSWAASFAMGAIGTGLALLPYR